MTVMIMKMKSVKNKTLYFLENHRLVRQMLRFSVIGTTAFILDTLLFWIFIKCGINQNIALAMAFILTLVYNYIFSIRWVFEAKKKNSSATMFVFAVLSVIGLVLTEIIYSVLIHLIIDYSLNIHPSDTWKLFAKVVSSFIVMIYNFVTRKLFLEKTLKKSDNR